MKSKTTADAKNRNEFLRELYDLASDVLDRAEHACKENGGSACDAYGVSRKVLQAMSGAPDDRDGAANAEPVDEDDEAG